MWDDMYFNDMMMARGRWGNPGPGAPNLVLEIKVPVTLHPGDANKDNIVNIIDLGILATNYDTLTGMTWDQGDFNNDGSVNIVDLGILATEYDWVGTAGASVPEPMTLGLLALAGLMIRRKK
jgi:hypothetical protein